MRIQGLLEVLGAIERDLDKVGGRKMAEDRMKKKEK